MDTRKNAMQRVQILLKSIMLRRQKDSVVDGQVVCTIPPKHINRENVKFSKEEDELYKALETKSQLTFNKYLEKGTVSGKSLFTGILFWGVVVFKTAMLPCYFLRPTEKILHQHCTLELS
jgi:SNF2 family DNA or RNA helicase